MSDAGAYRERGYLLRRKVFDPAPLRAEVDRAFAEGFSKTIRTGSIHENEFAAGQSGRYLPLMSARSPVSVSLLERFANSAEYLLGREILPVRSKAVLYAGETGWHVDSTRPIPSVGFVCYLDPLREETGALRVRSRGATVILDTEPGDLIIFDEHLEHASAGGRDRLQWRVDFVAAPRNEDEEREVRAYFADTYQPNWDGGYDVDLYPSYGEFWRSRARDAWNLGLENFGAYALAAREEEYARSRRADQNTGRE